MVVDEHNLLESLNYLKHRRGVDVKTKLTNAVKGEVDSQKLYEEKVHRVAEKLGVSTEGKDLDTLVKDVKEAQAKAKE